MQVSSYLKKSQDGHFHFAAFPVPGTGSGMIFILTRSNATGALAQKTAEEALRGIKDVLLLEEPETFTANPGRATAGELYRTFLKESVRQAGERLWHSSQLGGNIATAEVLAVILQAGVVYGCSIGSLSLLTGQADSLEARIVCPPAGSSDDGSSLGGEDLPEPFQFSFPFTEEMYLCMFTSEMAGMLPAKVVHEKLKDVPAYVAAEKLVAVLPKEGSGAAIVLEGDKFIKALAVRQYHAHLPLVQKDAVQMRKLNDWAAAFIDLDAVHVPTVEEPKAEGISTPFGTPVEEKRSPLPTTFDTEQLKSLAEKADQLQKEMNAMNSRLMEKDITIRNLKGEIDEQNSQIRGYRRAALAAIADIFRVWEQFPVQCEQVITKAKIKKMEEWSSRESGKE